ncbi:MAG: amino acid permease, partial [Balneolaceae bacterium]|nr:amino acid permease [Balneolaceae bacterium]
SGLGTWLALSFKSAFALVGLGAYLILFLALPIKPVAIALCVVFAALGISGVKNVGRFQGIFVSIILGLLGFFIAKGMFHTEATNFRPFFSDLSGSLLEAVGFVYISFAGITKIASVAEEVEDLDRNIPYGMMVAISITLVVYVLGLIVVVGVMPGEQLTGSMTPIADAAEMFMGPVGKVLITIGAIFSFVAAANAGLTAASRYPLAMSRDNLIGEYWKKIGRFNTPTRSTVLTMGLMILFILLLSPEGIAKLGSAFKLLIFGMINLAVVVMRESKITAYDPGYKTQLYPWVQIIGILTPIVLIPGLGILPVMLTLGVVVVGTLWYILYAKEKVDRTAAMYQVFQRMGSAATPKLDRELRQIIREKGARKGDVFEHCILRAPIIEHDEKLSELDVLREASAVFSERLDIPVEKIYTMLDNMAKMTGTAIGKHVALPHAKVEQADHPELVIVHSREGISVRGADEPIYAMFILISPEDKPRQHLRFLAELANRAEEIDFAGDWRYLTDQETIRNRFIKSEDAVETVEPDDSYVGTMIRDLDMHPDCLIAMINRNGELIVPHGNTRLEPHDVLTIVGKKDAVRETAKQFKNDS